MKILHLEIKKAKRTGILLLLPIVGILGAFFTYFVYYLQTDLFQTAHADRLDRLLTQLSGMPAVLTLLGILSAATFIYHLEFKGFAIKKMIVLPICPQHLFLAKWLLLSGLLLFAILLQMLGILSIHFLYFSGNEPDLGKVIGFLLYRLLTALPVLSFLLLIASRFVNVWIPLGIAVCGFLNGMAMVHTQNLLVLLNPFVLILKPLVAATAEPSLTVLTFSLLKTASFLLIGYLLAKYRYDALF